MTSGQIKSSIMSVIEIQNSGSRFDFRIPRADGLARALPTAIEDGHIVHDLEIDAQPGEPGSAELAAPEGRILKILLGDGSEVAEEAAE